MTWVQDLTGSVNGILGSKFEVRDGQKIPESDDLPLRNQAVKVEAAFLYADLAGSAALAAACPWDTTAKIIRAYLDCAIRLIKAYGGEVRSFDGDRVMGVFIGGEKNTNATMCAREIFWCTEHLIGPRATALFQSVKNSGIKIKQACGVDYGWCHAVRAGIRNNNDLIWVGRAPSFAAKLSDIREYPYCTFISDASYKVLMSKAKISGAEDMWEKRSYTFAGKAETIYRSKFTRTP